MVGDCNEATWTLKKIVALRLLSSIVIVAEVALVVHGEVGDGETRLAQTIIV